MTPAKDTSLACLTTAIVLAVLVADVDRNGLTVELAPADDSGSAIVTLVDTTARDTARGLRSGESVCVTLEEWFGLPVARRIERLAPAQCQEQR